MYSDDLETMRAAVKYGRAISEVAQLESTQKARQTYDQHKSEQRPFLRPAEQEGPA